MTPEGLPPVGTTLGPGPEARAIVAEAKRLRAAAARALNESGVRQLHARAAYEKARDEVVKQQLAAMPIARLRETTQGGVRFAAIEEAGIRTVAAAAAASPSRLMQIRGVGEHSAAHVDG